MEKLTKQEQKDLERLETEIDSITLQAFLEVGKRLKEINDRELWREGWNWFPDYVCDRFDLSKTRAYQLISAYEVHMNLSDAGLPPIQNERQARELALIHDPDERKEIWQQANEQAKGRVTAALIEKLRDGEEEKPSSDESSLPMVDSAKSKTAPPPPVEEDEQEEESSIYELTIEGDAELGYQFDEWLEPDSDVLTNIHVDDDKASFHVSSRDLQFILDGLCQLVCYYSPESSAIRGRRIQELA